MAKKHRKSRKSGLSGLSDQLGTYGTIAVLIAAGVGFYLFTRKDESGTTAELPKGDSLPTVPIDYTGGGSGGSTSGYTQYVEQAEKEAVKQAQKAEDPTATAPPAGQTNVATPPTLSSGLDTVQPKLFVRPLVPPSVVAKAVNQMSQNVARSKEEKKVLGRKIQQAVVRQTQRGQAMANRPPKKGESKSSGSNNSSSWFPAQK